jgi:hypothetical protein
MMKKQRDRGSNEWIVAADRKNLGLGNLADQGNEAQLRQGRPE